jgi:NADH-quinone oxidoreductase subunit N
LGFVLLALASAPRADAAPAVTYLASHSIATVGAFVALSLCESREGGASSLDDLRGLGRRHPFLGALFAIFLLSLAGLPVTGGFIAKWALFEAIIGAEWYTPVLIGVAGWSLMAFAYVRVIVVLFVSTPEPSARLVVPTRSVLAISVLLTLGALTLYGGALPRAVSELSDSATP